MPVYAILCPDCGHVARTLILAGCQIPSEWPCSLCGGRRAGPDPDRHPEPHPWESVHGAGCLCCGAPAGGLECAAMESDATRAS